MKSARTSALLVCAALVITARGVCAAERHPETSRAYWGFALGSSPNIAVDAPQGAYDEGAGINGGIQAGFDQRVFDALSLGGRFGMISWDSFRSGDLGYARFNVMLALEPRLTLPLGRRRAYVEAYLAAPIGLTWAGIGTPEHRAFREEAKGNGWVTGLGTGLNILGKHWGAFFEISYTRWTNDVTATYSFSGTSQREVEDFTYTTHLIMFYSGALVAF